MFYPFLYFYFVRRLLFSRDVTSQWVKSSHFRTATAQERVLGTVVLLLMVVVPWAVPHQPDNVAVVQHCAAG
jgi:hypothetical protein